LPDVHAKLIGKGLIGGCTLVAVVVGVLGIEPGGVNHGTDYR
jgi:hypothetical protein